MSVGLLGGGSDLVQRDVRMAVADVVGDGGGEEDGLLADHAYLVPQPFELQVSDVMAVQCYLEYCFDC